MKKIVLFFLAGLALAVIGGLYLLPKEQTAHEKALFNAPPKIWVISDTHYLAEELYDDGSAFQFIEKTSAGKDLRRAEARMEALLAQAKMEKPQALIISGDLTMNGEKKSAEKLATQLAAFEKAGIEVFVIPGNHDIHDGWARKYVGDKQEKTAQISPKDFKEIFAANGYDQAMASDPDSLSYTVPLTKDLTLLMIDSNLYSLDTSISAPVTKGQISEDTLNWIKEQLEAAKKAHKQVLPILHHNLFKHNDQVNKGYVLDDTRLREMLSEFKVPVAFSGHIHAQDILTESVAGQPLTEIVSGSFAITPNGYGEVTFNHQQLHYQRKELAMTKWAQETKQTDPTLLDYDQYREELFDKSGEEMAYRQLLESELTEDLDRADRVAQYVGKINTRFFKGADYTPSAADQQKMKQDPDYQTLQSLPKNFLQSYIDSILFDTNDNDLDVTIAFPMTEK